MEIHKEEKRKLKTFRLNNKEDFVYYLYQLICRSYKLLKRQDRYLNELSTYIEDVQRKNILKRTAAIDVPYEDYSDFLALQGHIETHLLNTLGDLQGSSLSYYKFRDLIQKKKKKKTLPFEMREIEDDILEILIGLNRARNFQNHEPESLITAEAKMVNEKQLLPVEYNPIKIINYETCTLEFLADLYKSYKMLNDGANKVFKSMILDYEFLLETKVEIIDVISVNSKGMSHLEAVKLASEIQG